MSTTKSPPSETAASVPTATGKDLVLVDLGRKSGKQIKKLRKNEGELAADVAATLEQLKADGVIGANVQPVIIVVERKSKKKGLFAFN